MGPVLRFHEVTFSFVFQILKIILEFQEKNILTYVFVYEWFNPINNFVEF